jgi:hypothetical protein
VRGDGQLLHIRAPKRDAVPAIPAPPGPEGASQPAWICLGRSVLRHKTTIVHVIIISK